MPANILVVEDEPAIQELLALNITQAGHNPIRALSVEIAQNLMRENSSRTVSQNPFPSLCSPRVAMSTTKYAA